MDRAEMDEIMERHFDAEAAHDLEALMGTLAEDAVHDVIGDPGGALSDPADIRRRYAQLFADFDNERVTPIRRLYGDDFMVDEAMVTARGRPAVRPPRPEPRGHLPPAARVRVPRGWYQQRARLAGHGRHSRAADHVNRGGRGRRLNALPGNSRPWRAGISVVAGKAEEGAIAELW